MSAVITITESQIFQALGTVLSGFGLTPSVPGATVPIIRGQINRVPEPTQADYVVMWSTGRIRMSTNFDTVIDSQITGSITGNVLTVTDVLNGTVAVGQTVYGPGVSPNVGILLQTSPTTFNVSPTANVASQVLYCGTVSMLQPSQVSIQCDVHGPVSADNAQRISTQMRDYVGVAAFQATGFDIAPLYADDPRQMPFTNAEQQLEERWVVDIELQVNATIIVTQEFASVVDVGRLVPVDAFYPE